jgi:hypothetical protein
LAESHEVNSNAGFDGGFNGDKFFVFQNGRHGGENNLLHRAMKLQFFPCRKSPLAGSRVTA